VTNFGAISGTGGTDNGFGIFANDSATVTNISAAHLGDRRLLRLRHRGRQQRHRDQQFRRHHLGDRRPLRLRHRRLQTRHRDQFRHHLGTGGFGFGFGIDAGNNATVTNNFGGTISGTAAPKASASHRGRQQRHRDHNFGGTISGTGGSKASASSPSATPP